MEYHLYLFNATRILDPLLLLISASITTNILSILDHAISDYASYPYLEI